MANTKRPQIFFASDVLDVVDYAECMAEKFLYAEEFIQAVIEKLRKYEPPKVEVDAKTFDQSHGLTDDIAKTYESLISKVILGH